MRRVARCCCNFGREFKEFTTRGNVLDLAVGIIIGTVFTNVVQSLVDDVITPPFGLLLGGVDFSNLTIKMNNFVYKDQPPVVIRYGKFIQSIITLLIMALVLFFIIKAVNHLYNMAARKKANYLTYIDIEASEEVKLLRDIRDLISGQISIEPKSIRF